MTTQRVPDPGGAALRVPLRPPEQVMRLERMGSFFPTRLSFMPTLIRQMVAEGWRFDRPEVALDENGWGHAVYGVECGARRYSLIAFSQSLEPDRRTDRVIKTAEWSLRR